MTSRMVQNTKLADTFKTLRSLAVLLDRSVHAQVRPIVVNSFRIMLARLPQCTRKRLRTLIPKASLNGREQKGNMFVNEDKRKRTTKEE